MMKENLLIDLSKCTGCELCVDICSSRKIGYYSIEQSRIRILRDEQRGIFVPLVCVQCREHPCLEACPVEAIQYDDEVSIFTVDEDLCTACGACTEVCPYQGIFLCAESAKKCDLCGGDPACIRVCYPQALRFFQTDETKIQAALNEKTQELARIKENKELTP